MDKQQWHALDAQCRQGLEPELAAIAARFKGRGFYYQELTDEEIAAVHTLMRRRINTDMVYDPQWGVPLTRTWFAVNAEYKERGLA